MTVPPEPSQLFLWVVAVVELFAVVTALVVVPRNRRPASATAWIILTVFVPVLGVLAFYVLGNRRLPAGRRRRQQNMDRLLNDHLWTHATEPDGPGPWLAQVVRLNRRTGALPMLEGNRASLHADYDGCLAAIAADIDAATSFVHVEFYILTLDAATTPVFDAMRRAVARGVAVRVLLDHLGSWRSPGYRRTLRRLRADGVRWQLMLPVQPWFGRLQRPDLRNHRKLVVLDGTLGWVGSQNLVDAGYGKRSHHRRGRRWQDLMVRLEGPAVDGLEAVFRTDWYSETAELLELRSAPPVVVADGGPDGGLDVQVIPSGPGFEHENNLNLFNSLLYAARRRVSITSPYFVPDESLLYAVVAAALRGVEVELFVPEQADQLLVHHAQRSYYEQLLRAGVRVRLHPSPAVLHAKHMSVDEDVAVVGSSNLDIRSFSLNLECSLLVHGRSFSRRLHEVEDGYRAVSRELTLDEWVRRPRWQRITDDLARLTSAVQ